MTLTTPELAKVELSPCPFCQQSDQLRVGYVRATDEVQWWQIECVREKCGSHGPYADTEAEAIAAWNQRDLRPDDALREAVDRAREHLASAMATCAGCATTHGDDGGGLEAAHELIAAADVELGFAIAALNERNPT